MKKIDDLRHCTVPVCFENEDDTYKYCLQGTAFIIRYKSKLFAVTAKHVIEKYKPTQVALPYEIGSVHFLPLGCGFQMRTQEFSDTDHMQGVIFPVVEEELEDGFFHECNVYNMDQAPHITTSPATDGTKLVVHGFPDELNEVNYDERHLEIQRLSLSAIDAGLSEYKCIKKIQFDDNAWMSTFSGMSGAPVFIIQPYPPNRSRVELAGMLLRATPESCLGYYLDEIVIRRIIEQHIATQTR